MNRELKVQVGDREVACQVVRSARRRRTISLTFDHTNGLRVLAPLRSPEAEIRLVIANNLDWIARTIDRPAPVANSLVGDDGCAWYRGTRVPVRVERGGRGAMVEREIPGLVIRVARSVPDEQLGAKTDAALLRWYREETTHLLREPLARCSKAMSVTAVSISVRNQKTLWGSCSHAGKLAFNLRLAMVPQELLEYVVIHELAHIAHHNHSPAFWEHVARFEPRFRERRVALNTLSRTLPRTAV